MPAGAAADEPPPLGWLKKPTTSAFVRRPSLPEPAMAPGSRLFSSTRRRTEGLSLPASFASLSEPAEAVFAAEAEAPLAAEAAAPAAGVAPAPEFALEEALAPAPAP